MSFHVGQKVVCVDDRRQAGWDRQWVTRGAVYEIQSASRRVYDPANLFPGNGVTVTLVGVTKPGAFAAPRFRPLVEDRKSVSFTIGADPDSERWDNRKKRKEKV